MANFDAQVVELIGGTLDQVACDQWAVDGAREIIMQLPASLQERCSDKTSLGDGSPNPTALDLDDADNGKVLYCTRNNGTYDIPCRLVSPVNAHLTEDSTASNYYAVANDPAYFIRDNKVEIRPQPTDANVGYVYHIIYPTSINISDVSTIANFPIECEHLLVKYIAMHQLLANQSAMSSSFNSDITGAFTATNTELDETQAICDLINTQADSAVTALGNMATEIALANAEVDLANPEVDLAKAEILETVTLIDGGIDTAVASVKTSADLVGAEVVLANAEVDLEDMEKASGYIQTAQGFLAEASGYVNEVNARVAQVNGQIAVANGYLATASGYNQTGQAYLGTASSYGNQASGFLNAAAGFASELGQKIAIANGYIAEANARLGADNAKYQWFGDHYAKLAAEYAAGLAALKGV